jgi:hypothetical protein
MSFKLGHVAELHAMRLLVSYRVETCKLLLTCGEVNTVKRSFFVGKGIGPLTLATVRLAASTISIADLS